MRESYVLKYKSHDPDTPTYMKSLSAKHVEEYHKSMDDESQSIMRRYTWDIVSRKSVAGHNVIIG